MLLLALNEAYDKHSIDALLMVRRLGSVWIKGDGLLDIAGLIASGLVDAKSDINTIFTGQSVDGRMTRTAESGYLLTLSPKGSVLVEAWITGNQEAAVDI